MSSKYVKMFRRSEKVEKGYSPSNIKWEFKVNTGLFLIFWALVVIGLAFEFSNLCDKAGGANTATGVLLGFLTLMSAIGGVSMFVGGVIQSLQNNY